MKVVQLDRNTLGYDIDTSVFKNFGEYESYDSDTLENNKEHIKDADVVIFNKAKMNEEMLKDIYGEDTYNELKEMIETL